MTQILVKVEITKALLDGEWHSSSCLAAYANYLIRPEIAYRAYIRSKSKTYKQSDEQRIAAGKKKIVYGLLRNLVKVHRVERRNREQVVEWRLVDHDWAEAFLKNYN